MGQLPSPKEPGWTRINAGIYFGQGAPALAGTFAAQTGAICSPSPTAADAFGSFSRAHAQTLSLGSPSLLRAMRRQGCRHPPPAQGTVSSAVEAELASPGTWKLPSEWGLEIMNPRQRVNKQHPAHMPSCTQDPGDSSLTRATMFFDPLPARYGTVRLRTVGSRGYKC